MGAISSRPRVYYTIFCAMSIFKVVDNHFNRSVKMVNVGSNTIREIPFGGKSIKVFYYTYFDILTMSEDIWGRLLQYRPK